jgi:hypothetical protein
VDSRIYIGVYMHIRHDVSELATVSLTYSDEVYSPKIKQELPANLDFFCGWKSQHTKKSSMK